MRLITAILLLAALPLAAADLVVRNPDATAPHRLEFVFVQIDSTVDGAIYGPMIGPPERDSTGAYTGRDTTYESRAINWGVADTLRGVSIALDSVQVQGVTLLLSGTLKPRDYVVDSAAVAEDSVWRAGR